MTLINPHGSELLDRPDADPHLVRRNLADLSKANRWLGGRRALSLGLRRTLGDLSRGTRLTLLDIGTGSGDLPAYCHTWGLTRGLTITPVGLERVPAAAKIAAGNGLPTLIGCASAFPIRSKSVDVVLVSQVVHHFTRDAAVELLGECDRFARQAVIMVELTRSNVAAAAFQVASRILGFDHTTIEDGLTSIERGLTKMEARSLLSDAGVPATVTAVAPYRLIATWAPLQQGGEQACEQ